MKKLSHLLSLIALLSLVGSQAFAAETPTQATVQKISGSNAQVKMSASDSPRALAEGEKLPQGATIITGAGTEVFISAMDGSVSAIRQNTEVELEKLSITRRGGNVTKQSALLNLKKGNLVSTLDPAKKAINDYGVRTPRGVAAARGTTYTVTLAAGVYLVTVLNGNVSVQPPGGGAPIPVISGEASTGGTAQPIASVTGVSAAVMQDVVSAAVSTVASIAAAPNLANASGLSPTQATALLQTTVETVVQSAPAQATNAVAQAAAAVASVPGQGANASAAMTTLVQTAVKAAATSTTSGGPSVQNIVQAASQGAATTAANTNAASTTATTIAAAAAQGVSGTSSANSATATAIAQAVVQGTQTGAANNTVSNQVSGNAQSIATTVQSTVTNTVQTNVTPPAGAPPVTVAPPTTTPPAQPPPPVVTTPPVDPSVNVSRSN